MSTEPRSDDPGLDPEFNRLDCSAVIADVWLLLDNECDPGARSRLQAHLDGCPSCLAHYGIEQQLKALVNRKCGGDQAPEGLRERLRVEIRKTVIVSETTYRETRGQD
ncbi:mycothiol system anti-sigma-R factor [Gordonia soli]|uniref:Putative anti-sigma factor n=1 Tax=Gordonia soli NBRC 108243 TaxID=1223545 RepID=M0QE66_9ACTN|nr:mycothiol system anti-sigma-R factor [Gordonia soli]GAC66631.1 putative anti-sigma factor [Gordonia soli NBRC 108243]